MKEAFITEFELFEMQMGKRKYIEAINELIKYVVQRDGRSTCKQLHILKFESVCSLWRLMFFCCAAHVFEIYKGIWSELMCRKYLCFWLCKIQKWFSIDWMLAYCWSLLLNRCIVHCVDPNKKPVSPDL